MHFTKYHALGNDYLVVDPAGLPSDLAEDWVVRLCDRHRGVGADGVLLGPLPAAEGFGLRIFNPDGSEAALSGNGLRIFAHWLWQGGQVGLAPFVVTTPARTTICRVHPGGALVTVEMGRAIFDSRAVPVTGPAREVLEEEIVVAGRALRFCAVSMGNPHCVIFTDDPTPALACQLGPLVERDSRFPDRTNVQFAQVLSRSSLRIEIWERGAGYTLASGSSSCAAAAAARRLGLCDAEVTVSMPGGSLAVAIAPDWTVTLQGPATRVCAGVVCSEVIGDR